MTDINNNCPNQDNSRDNNVNNQNQYNKAPEYSFWAEQVPSNSYSYNNQATNNSWQNNQVPNNSWQNTNQIPNINQIPNMDQYNNIPRQNVKKKSGGKVIKFIGKSICFGLLAAVSFIGVQKLIEVVYPDVSSFGIISAIDDSSSDKNYEVSYTDTGTVKAAKKTVITAVADATLPAIVSINCTSTQTAQDWFGQQTSEDVESSGSGIIVGKNEKELLIATNNHVVEGANETYVTFADGTKAEAKTKGTDTTADLAVVAVDISLLKEETLSAITVAKLGDSDAVKVGEMAIAIGNALGYGQSVTVGYISAKDREVDVSDGYDSSKKMTFLQTDAAINPGNSGGALININGEVIGINTVKYASDEVEGMGYAIPISIATPIIKELMSREILSADQQGYLGVSGYDVTEDASSYYNIPIGVYIKEVSKGAAADKAGLLAEDVITKVNDIEITSMIQLKEYVNSLKVGTKVEVTYMRNTDGEYKEAKVTVTLGKNPQLSSTTE